MSEEINTIMARLREANVLQGKGDHRIEFHTSSNFAIPLVQDYVSRLSRTSTVKYDELDGSGLNFVIPIKRRVPKGLEKLLTNLEVSYEVDLEVKGDYWIYLNPNKKTYDWSQLKTEKQAEKIDGILSGFGYKQGSTSPTDFS